MSNLQKSFFYLSFSTYFDEGSAPADVRHSDPFKIDDEDKYWYTVKFIAELINRKNASALERLKLLDVLLEQAWVMCRLMVCKEVEKRAPSRLESYLPPDHQQQELQFTNTLVQKVGTLAPAEFATWFLTQLKKPKIGEFSRAA